MTRYVGLARDGQTVLEVGVFDTTDGRRLVIHADEARPQYRRKEG